jgi:ribosomal protein S14
VKFKRIYLNNNQNKVYRKLETNNLKVKFLIFSLLNKNIIFFFLNKFLQNTMPILKVNKIKNFCIESGRAKGLQKTLWLSRIKLREFVNNSLLNGVKKAS